MRTLYAIKKTAALLLSVLLACAAGCSARADAASSTHTPAVEETSAVSAALQSQPANPQQPSGTPQTKKRSVAYFTSWSVYARGLSVSDLDATLLTHVNLAFANLKEDGEICVGDTWADCEKPGKDGSIGNLGGLQALKKKYPHLQTLVSVGGWTWSGNFSGVAADSVKRQKFAQSAVAFLTKYGLDGLDIDWEYPVEGGNGIPHRADDGKNFTLLLRETRAALDAQGAKDGKHYLLTIAGGGSDSFVRNTEPASLVPYLDFINLMTYDYHGSWDAVSGHNAPLYSTDGISVSHTVEAYLNAGVPADRMNLGLAFYGRGWEDAKSTNNGLGQSAHTPTGTGYGKGTWESGCFDYWDIAQNYVGKNGYVRYFDSTAKVPYLYNGSVFLSYDDPESIRAKLAYAKEKGLGGAMFWEFNGDKNKELQKVTADALGVSSQPIVTPPIWLPASSAPAAAALPAWDAKAVYTAGDKVSYEEKNYRAKWWTQGERPDGSGEWGPWEQIQN